MNSNKLAKHEKRKVINNLTMGQKASNSQSSCSILCVDEDIEFVVDNNDDSGSKYSATIPVDKNIELSRRTYSKKSPVTYPLIPPSPNKGPFEFSVFSEVKAMTSEALKCFTKPKPQVKRKFNGGLDSPTSEKILKIDAKCKSSPQISFPKAYKESKCKQKISYVENGISSDSDIELIEEVIVNPHALNLKSINNLSSKKPVVHSQSFSNNNKKLKDISESIKKKSETKPLLHASKPCFISDNQLVVNEADTAPYMPNNPNIFPDTRCVSSPVKWGDMNGTLEKPHCDNRNVIKKRSFSQKSLVIKPSLSPELKEANVSKRTTKRELKNLYENLNEISWSQENSFKKLLQNRDSMRYSERNTGRVSGSGKALRKMKQITLKKGSKASPVKKSPTLQASLKKSKLAKANTNKRLAKINSNCKDSKANNKFAKHKTSKLMKLDVNKLSPTNDIKMSKLNAKVKSSKFNLKANISPTDKIVNNLEKSIQLKNVKKQKNVVNEKSKGKARREARKVKKEVKRNNADIPKSKDQIVSEPKTEVSEASGSNMQEVSEDGDGAYSDIPCNKNLKKFKPQDFDERHYQIYQEYTQKQQMYSAVRKGSQCRVQIKPLEHTNFWNTEYYEEFRKNFMHHSTMKAMEQQDQNCITEMLQELCESYMMPTENKSKKKKPEEETLRSRSARQMEGAFRNKEIFVKKGQNHIQVILVPSYTKKNCLSIDAIKELKEAFVQAKKDPKCKAVLINSGGPYFCTGIDLAQLIGNNKKQACEEMATVIKELVLVLACFSKPIVAAVNGDVFGFGVSLLTYCDVVLASDKAMFGIPSTTIGYMAEGGLTITLPYVMGQTRSNEMLLQGTRITAAQALQKGLVTDVFFPSNLMYEVMPRLESIISQPLAVMEATKLLVRSNVWERLRTHMDFERQLLVHQWLSSKCQENIKRILKGDTFLD